MAAPDNREPQPAFPIAAGIFFGLGLGGFFDGIVLHQLLQWHHMLSSWYPVNSLENLELNTRWDGIFHSATYLFVLIGLYLLWHTAHRRHLYWSTRLLIGTIILGFGIFNTVEGIVDHHWLGIHHVNETVARDYWPIWDIGFTLWGVSMIRRLAGDAGRPAGDATMIRAIPPAALYGLFALGAVLATYPTWSLWLFGFEPTLDDLLSFRCLGL